MTMTEKTMETDDLSDFHGRPQPGGAETEGVEAVEGSKAALADELASFARVETPLEQQLLDDARSTGVSAYCHDTPRLPIPTRLHAEGATASPASRSARPSRSLPRSAAVSRS
jgi:hypothetical protein